MFSEAKITEIYCMADDFCKEFANVQEKYLVTDKTAKHRNKPNRMSDAEIMVILILFHLGSFSIALEISYPVGLLIGFGLLAFFLWKSLKTTAERDTLC